MKHHPSKKSKKNMLWTIGGIVLVGAGIYAGVGFYYNSHFFPQTALNGLNCSGLTVEQVKHKIQTQIEKYRLTVKERGGHEEVLTAEQIGLTYVDDQKVDELLEKQNAFAWPSAMIRRNQWEFSAGATYDPEQVTALVGQFSCFQEENIQAPTDAYINDNGTAYEIVPETEGNQVNQEGTVQAVLEAIDHRAETLDLEEKDLYVKPNIVSTDEKLNEQLTELNQLTAANVTFDFTDRSYTVDRGVIKEWLVQDEEGHYSVDREKAAAWVRQMAYETDTFGLEHSFQTSLGPVIQLKAGGDYGWCINKDATTEQLLEAIRNGSVETMEPVYLYRGKDRSRNDIGNTYVEVCISKQKMWCYKDGVLVAETPVVTGCQATHHDTPSGSVWAVDGKKSDYDFKKYQAHVKYWLPFNGDVGLHDASWRGSFGGDIYKTNGSHGCVNTPESAMAKIFSAIEIGDPVIVYDSIDQVKGPDPTEEAGV